MIAKRSLPLVVVLVACLSFGAQTKSDKKFWTKQYAAINSMFQRKDMDAFGALLAPDFYEVDQSGKKMTRDEFVKTEVEPIKEATSVKSHVKVTSISVKGDDAQIGYDWKFSMVMGTNKIVGREVGVDGWHRSGGKWLNVSTTVKSATSKTTPIKPKKKK